MYKREFDNLLKSKMVKLLMLYGDNEYLIDYYVDYYIQNLDAKNDMISMYYEQYNFQTALSYLSQNSLFGGVNLLIIKSDKKINKKELDKLIDITKRGENNYLIYAFEGSSKNAKTLQNSFNQKNSGVWVRFFETTINDAMDMLKAKANKINLKIDHYAMQHLYMILNHNLALSINELDKLAILDREITTKEIDNLVYSTAPLAVEQLLMSIFQKQDIIPLIKILLDLGEDEFSILRATQHFLNQLFLFNAYIKIHGTVDSQAILGFRLPKHIEEQRANLATKISSSNLLKIYEHLLISELELKESKPLNRDSLLLGILIKIQSYL